VEGVTSQLPSTYYKTAKPGKSVPPTVAAFAFVNFLLHFLIDTETKSHDMNQLLADQNEHLNQQQTKHLIIKQMHCLGTKT